MSIKPYCRFLSEGVQLLAAFSAVHSQSGVAVEGMWVKKITEIIKLPIPPPEGMFMSD